MIATHFIQQGYPVRKVLKYCGVAASSYYYRSRQGGVRGRKPSQYTFKTDGTYVANTEVVKEVEQLLQREFVDYGYIKVTHWLRKQGYVINAKKVYRLMKASQLLYKKRKVKRGNKVWVKELVPAPHEIFEHLEVDIKYFHIAGKDRKAKQVTIIDVKSRWVLGFYIGFSIKQRDIQRLFEWALTQYPTPQRVYVRNDNGSEFEAHMVRAYFARQTGVVQEFTKPATPEQNGHIEGFHSILYRTIEKYYDFEQLSTFIETMHRFIKFYNNERIHSGVGYDSPLEYLMEKAPELVEAIQAAQGSFNTLISHQLQGLNDPWDDPGHSFKSISNS
jgi:transposase InsO family protein